MLVLQPPPWCRGEIVLYLARSHQGVLELEGGFCVCVIQKASDFQSHAKRHTWKSPALA